MPNAFNIRLLTSADLMSAVALSRSAAWNQTAQDWEALLEVAPESCFALVFDGRIVASATVVVHSPALAWIGMVLTLPEFRGRGLGTAVFRAALEYCHQKRIACVKLDATAAGQPLYARHTFVVEYAVERWGTADGNAWRAPSAPGPTLVDLDVVRVSSLITADAIAFGVPRARLICALMRRSSWAACIESRGEALAYAMARRGQNAHYFGPCVAEYPEQAAALLDAFLQRHSGEPVFLDFPAVNKHACTLAQARGFEVRRTLMRMYSGDNSCVGKPEQVFALAGFEYG